ncbi:unnamed protein product [Mycena citricolor]|uniref:Uncharacterized protein n=1 Tax=Mycena citricolor TaxID=2018698 RepID=A0AAD2HX18_9AGAR|nr:unnamed protein product [Mycena citricolor]CAK5282766.1 unnamed protein product [Mycena citricolor]
MTDMSDYHLQCQLSSHTGAIYTLKAREDGRFLASGGGIGLKVWDLQEEREIDVVVVTSDVRGAITKLQWIKREDDMGEALVYGTQSGYITLQGKSSVRVHEIWNRQMAGSSEVTGLAFDPATNRLAACHHGGIVQMFMLGAKMAEKEMFSLQIPCCVPGALGFGAMHNNERELLVSGLYCGVISDVAVDLANGIFCVSDPSTGVLLYRLNGGGELVKRFKVPVTKTRRLQQVALHDSNRAIVVGSDHGVVYVYTRRDGSLTKLVIEENEWVQTVAVSTGLPHTGFQC